MQASTTVVFTYPVDCCEFWTTFQPFTQCWVSLFTLIYPSSICFSILTILCPDLAQGADALALIGGLKNVISFVIPFYINSMVKSIGVQGTFVAMAMISLGLFVIFVFSLIFYGERLREWSGQPGWNRSMLRPPAAAIDAASGQQY